MPYPYRDGPELSQNQPTEPDLVVLLPEITNWNRTRERYGGLASELLARGVSVEFVEMHDRYTGDGVFRQGLKPVNPQLGAIDSFDESAATRPRVVRDLTMPKQERPLYTDPQAPVLVHHPSINELLRSKGRVYELMSHVQPKSIPFVESCDIEEAIAEMPGSRVVIKPDTGMAGEGVLIGSKQQVLDELKDRSDTGLVIVQEAIDMSRGIKVGDNETPGVHNARFIVIGLTAIFGFVRSDATGSPTLQGETFKNLTFLPPEKFGDSLQGVLHKGIEAFQGLPHSHDTVVAFDLIRGTGHDGEQRDYLLEVNRRPLRNSPYDGRDAGTLWASWAWDVAEADMLHDVVRHN